VHNLVSDIQVVSRVDERGDEILTPDALAFVEELPRRFGERALQPAEDRKPSRGAAMERPGFVLPDRSGVTMTASIMRAYTDLLFQPVALSAPSPISDGFDGSWVAHPGLVPICQEVFDRHLGDRPISSMSGEMTSRSLPRSC